MKTRRRHPLTVTALILVGALVFSAVNQIGAGIICIGSDGHVDIEPPVCSCCTEITHPDENLHDGLAPAGSSCSDCVDVPLEVLSLNPKSLQLVPPDFYAEHGTHDPIRAGSCRIDFVVRENQMDQHWQCLSPLSSVVLLI